MGESGLLSLAIVVAAVMALVLIHDAGCFITAGSTTAPMLGATTAALVPSAAHMAAMSPETIDVGSSINVATLTEGLICGIAHSPSLAFLFRPGFNGRRGPHLDCEPGHRTCYDSFFSVHFVNADFLHNQN